MYNPGTLFNGCRNLKQTFNTLLVQHSRIRTWNLRPIKKDYVQIQLCCTSRVSVNLSSEIRTLNQIPWNRWIALFPRSLRLSHSCSPLCVSDTAFHFSARSCSTSFSNVLFVLWFTFCNYRADHAFFPLNWLAFGLSSFDTVQAWLWRPSLTCLGFGLSSLEYDSSIVVEAQELILPVHVYTRESVSVRAMAERHNPLHPLTKLLYTQLTTRKHWATFASLRSHGSKCVRVCLRGMRRQPLCRSGACEGWQGFQGLLSWVKMKDMKKLLLWPCLFK